MKPRKTDEEIVQIESRVLRALSQGTTEGSIREFARATLRQYRWRDRIHQATFEALMAIASESAEAARAQLPSRLTRMGFPDFNWEDLFAAPRLSKAEAEQLIAGLTE